MKQAATDPGTDRLPRRAVRRLNHNGLGQIHQPLRRISTGVTTAQPPAPVTIYLRFYIEEGGRREPPGRLFPDRLFIVVLW